MIKRLTRLNTDRKIAGILGGIAEYFRVDSTLARLIFVIALIPSMFTLTLIYFVAYFIIPKDREV
ncbi:PspC domain-containing protein [Virgibacillus ndiopensis]|uniref:PspC domain-containing protein n=1 Tax=Virgibacillus ndiopensis TaxID=2004408 RepID=UPI000C071388|nr:PspC domain-containing protein [Virgibacillus ndiopensis]